MEIDLEIWRSIIIIVTTKLKYQDKVKKGYIGINEIKNEAKK
jgi:hypothetical protein